ncbi:MAG: REP-associated tyrosine transposase [Chthoniobacterales bacterium]
MHNVSGRKHPVHLPVRGRLDIPTIVFVTVCTKNRKPLLANADSHNLILDSWSAADSWLVGRYVLMPDHAHLFCAPATPESPALATWLRFWKSHATRHWPNQAEVPIWQRHFWDRELRQRESYAQKWDYVRQNPVRAGLISCEDDWPYQGEMHELRW